MASDHPPSRRQLGRLALGGAVIGLGGALSWRYAAWSSPARNAVVFGPGEGDGIELRGQVLLVKEAQGVRALSARCTHLGCTVGVAEDGGSLICPCHGSEYGLDGAVLRGPAGEALAKLPVDHLEDGSCRVVPP